MLKITSRLSTNSNQSYSMGKQDASRSSIVSKQGNALNKKFQKISKIELNMFDEIEDPDERERLFVDTIERMRKAIEDLHLKEAMNAKKIQRLKGDNLNLKEKLDDLDIDLKATEKAKELVLSFLKQLNRILTIYYSKRKLWQEAKQIKKLQMIQEPPEKLKD